jgi:hypothetical protein
MGSMTEPSIVVHELAQLDDIQRHRLAVEITARAGLMLTLTYIRVTAHCTSCRHTRVVHCYTPRFIENYDCRCDNCDRMTAVLEAVTEFYV